MKRYSIEFTTVYGEIMLFESWTLRRAWKRVLREYTRSEIVRVEVVYVKN